MLLLLILGGTLALLLTSPWASSLLTLKPRAGRCFVTGMVFGLVAAPVCGALIGGIFGMPFICEPNYIPPGFEGMMIGVMGFAFCFSIPAAVLGAILGAILDSARAAAWRPR
jgi:hypothetical protein